MDAARLEAKARAVVAAWTVWAEAEGWDNPEWTDLAAALGDLEEFLGAGAEAPAP